MSNRANSGVRVTDLDIPFLNLTWFFVKASLAGALAIGLTSWLWVLIGTGMATLSALLVVGLGVPAWFEGEPMVPQTAPAPAVVVLPAPVEPPPPPPAQAAAAEEPAEPDAAALPPVDPDAARAATEAAQRAELHRVRREREREGR